MSRFRRTTLLVAFLAATPAIVHAQDEGKGFLFGAPRGSVTLSGGWAAATAGSNLFSFTTNQLTLRRGDFSSPTFGGDFAFNLAARTQVVLSVNSTQTSKSSEFRDYTDQNQQPIEQKTTFRRVPLTVGIKQYLTSPGRSVGRLAWVPSRLAPYVAAGVGTTWYDFRQEGDFIDFDTNNIFHDRYDSNGWGPSGYAAAGFDYSIGPRYAVTTGVKYTVSHGALSSDFSGFNNLDLSGLATTVGFTVRF